jgi:hypothetical protein
LQSEQDRVRRDDPQHDSAPAPGRATRNTQNAIEYQPDKHQPELAFDLLAAAGSGDDLEQHRARYPDRDVKSRPSAVMLGS